MDIEEKFSFNCSHWYLCFFPVSSEPTNVQEWFKLFLVMYFTLHLKGTWILSCRYTA